MSFAPETLPVGTVLDGKWRVEGVLGSGGMGQVYAARHVRNGREAAIKILHPMIAADPSARQRFLHEGYAANQVSHPGTVQILDDGTAREGAYLVMERLHGAPVDALADRTGGRMALSPVLAILEAMLEVLEVAHRQAIVHRDIKPENLFITEDGRLKILDFGLARVTQNDAAARLTTQGVPMGTPAFMSPEQALARWDEVDARSDVFSVGASAWTLLTGTLVHDAATTAELMVRACTRRAAPMASVVPTLHPAIAAVLDRSLAFERERRWANAGEMRVALRQAVAASGVPLPALAVLLATVSDDPTVSADHITLPRLNPLAVRGLPRSLHPEASPTATGAPLTSDSGKYPPRKRRILLALASGVGLLAAIVGLLWYQGQRTERPNVEGATSPQAASAGAASSNSTSIDVSPQGIESAAVGNASPSSAVSVSVWLGSAAPTVSAAPASKPRPKAGPTVAPSSKPPCDVRTDYNRCKGPPK